MATMMNQHPQPRPGSAVAEVNASSQEARPLLGSLVVFLLASILASVNQQVAFFSLIPEGLRPFLGDPPSAQLVNLALAIYFVSTLVIIAHGICCGGRPGSLWFHGVCRSIFYLLYFIGGGLAGHLWLVLLVGLMLFGLECLWLRMNQRRASWGLC
jgi:hypothetical protein